MAQIKSESKEKYAGEFQKRFADLENSEKMTRNAIKKESDKIKIECMFQCEEPFYDIDPSNYGIPGSPHYIKQSLMN